MYFFCRVGSDASSTGFAGAAARFAMNRQVFFLPFEEDAREKETLPAPGSGGAYLRCPAESPTNAPTTPPTPSWHHLTRAGLPFLSGERAFHCAFCLPSRSTVWPSLFSYFIYVLIVSIFTHNITYIIYIYYICFVVYNSITHTFF